MVGPALLAALTAAVARAAAVVLAVSRSPLEVREKGDRSPVTDADERAQAVLLDAIAKLMPGVTAVSEEMPVRPLQLSDVFVLIDPLDGTREYVAGSGEYTVNLGVVRGGVPLAGIVAVPAEGLIYRGAAGWGAERLKMTADGATCADALVRPVKVRPAPRGGLVAAISRSHLDPATVALLDRLGVATRIQCGSALKFCRIAEGAADLYPRLATTCEWDVAAGHALLAAAGGSVTLPDGGTLRYGAVGRDFRIPAFIAWGDRAGVLGHG
jgi:3'(2'), 5'-bisphosphate nucleotidase